MKKGTFRIWEGTRVKSKNPQVASYIAQARQSGQTNEQIKATLLGVGWNENAINEGLNG